jgi:hypothetical protein
MLNTTSSTSADRVTVYTTWASLANIPKLPPPSSNAPLKSTVAVAPSTTTPSKVVPSGIGVEMGGIPAVSSAVGPSSNSRRAVSAAFSATGASR